MLEVHAIRTLPEEDFDPFVPLFSGLLPAESLHAVMRLRKADDRQRSLLGEVLARELLSSRTSLHPKEISIRRLKKGKPVLPGSSDLHFNVSHSAEWVAVAVAEQEVGIDVEKIREPQYRIAERFFSPEELAALNACRGPEKRSYFFDLWTLKESYLKLLGRGLTKSLGSFTLRKTGHTFSLVVDGKQDYTVQFFQYPLDPDYKLSLCRQTAAGEGRFQRITVGELANRIEKW